MLCFLLQFIFDFFQKLLETVAALSTSFVLLNNVNCEHKLHILRSKRILNDFLNWFSCFERLLALICDPAFNSVDGIHFFFLFIIVSLLLFSLFLLLRLLFSLLFLLASTINFLLEDQVNINSIILLEIARDWNFNN